MALLALKKKKYQEGLFESTSSQLMNLEQLVSVERPPPHVVHSLP